MDFSVTERERRTPAPQAEQRLSDARRLCGNHLYVMKLPFSHSPSVIKPSQAMRTARHQHGGRCNSYGNRYAACLSGMSVNIKQIETKEQPRRFVPAMCNDDPNETARLLSQQLNRKEHPSMEHKTLEPFSLINQQIDRRTQVLTIEGCRVKINYLPSCLEKSKENVLDNIQKSLLAACQSK